MKASYYNKVMLNYYIILLFKITLINSKITFLNENL